MITAVISVYKVANFPEGGGHFWVYMQYVQGLLRLGCDVYWLEQIMPTPDPEGETHLLATFIERMKRFGLEGKTLLYAVDRDREGDAGSFRFFGCTSSEAEAVLRRADLLLNFHYAIDPRLLASVRRTALVDIDPGLLQYWMSTGQLVVQPHDHYLTTGETVGTPDARFSDCGLPWIHIRPPVCLDLWPFIADPPSEAFTTVSSWMTGDFLKVTENGKTFLRERSRAAPRRTGRTFSGLAASSVVPSPRVPIFKTRGSATGRCATWPAASPPSCSIRVRARFCLTGKACFASRPWRRQPMNWS